VAAAHEIEPKGAVDTVLGRPRVSTDATVAVSSLHFGDDVSARAQLPVSDGGLHVH